MNDTRRPEPRNAAGWSIRRYEYGDLLACSRIFKRGVMGFNWYKRTLVTTRHLRASLDEGIAWVAVEPKAGVVGFITLYEKDAYIHYLFVDPDWQFCGVGRGLLEIARARIGRPLDLKVDCPNKHARAAYAQLGWHETGKRGLQDGVEWVRLRGP